MFKSPTTRITGVFKSAGTAAGKLKDRVIGATSDLLSAPSRYLSKKKQEESDRIYKAIKLVKASEGKPDSGDYRDPLFQARATAAAFGYKPNGKKKDTSLAKK